MQGEKTLFMRHSNTRVISITLYMMMIIICSAFNNIYIYLIITQPNLNYVMKPLVPCS